MARLSVWVLASAVLVVILIASVEGEDLAREKRLAQALAYDPAMEGLPKYRGKRLALASDPTIRERRLARVISRGKRLAQPPQEYLSEAGRQRRWQMHGF